MHSTISLSLTRFTCNALKYHTAHNLLFAFYLFNTAIFSLLIVNEALNFLKEKMILDVALTLTLYREELFSSDLLRCYSTVWQMRLELTMELGIFESRIEIDTNN